MMIKSSKKYIKLYIYAFFSSFIGYEADKMEFAGLKFGVFEGETSIIRCVFIRFFYFIFFRLKCCAVSYSLFFSKKSTSEWLLFQLFSTLAHFCQYLCIQIKEKQRKFIKRCNNFIF